MRGNYKIKDSLITLDRSEIRNVIVSNKLAIRIDSTNTKMLIQIDNKHSVLNDNFKFIVNDDFEN